MTNEKAIVRMYYRKVYCTDNMGCDWECEKCNEAEIMAIKALEKQIPKKPIFTSMNYGTITCRNCNKPIPLDEYTVTEEWKKENQYCRLCGQRLEWE